MKRNQGSLEYLIIIGGVIILAAATYFMLRGFSQTTGAGTTETIGVAGEKYMLELENLGRSETRFSAKKWANPLLQKRTLMEFSSLGDVTFNATNLTAHGVQVSSLEFYFFDGSFHELNYTISGEILTVHSGSACCANYFDLYMFYNNFTALINPCLANYTGPPRSSCGTIPLPDPSPPTVNISQTAYGLAGSVVDAKINVTVNGTGSNVSEVYYRIGDSVWFPADNMYYNQGGITVEAHPVDGSYNSELEIVHILVTVPDEGNYSVSVRVTDEYSNEKIETQDVNISVGEGTEPSPPSLLLMAFHPPQPFQEGYLNFSAILGTTEGIDWCRLKVNNSATELVNTLMDLGSESAYATAGTFAEDLYTAIVNCSDSTGNEDSLSVDFEVDKTATFANDISELNVTFMGERYNSSARIGLPLEATVINASINITGFSIPKELGFYGPVFYGYSGLQDSPIEPYGGDFDNDGNLDVVLLSYDGDLFSYFSGKGDGTFQQTGVYTTGEEPTDIYAGDFDNDSNLDVVTANNDYNDRTFSYFEGNGDGTFQGKVDYPTVRCMVSIGGGDFDNDGNLDVVACGECTSGTFSYFKGFGNGSFDTGVNYAAGDHPRGIYVDDFDNNGNLDVVLVSENPLGFSYFNGSGDGTFQTRVDYATTGYPLYTYGGDFNNDGNPDLVVVHCTESCMFGYFEGFGNGSFQAGVDYAIGENTYGYAGVYAGDFDNDSSLDVVVTNGQNLSYFEGNGDGTFNNTLNYTSEDRYQTGIYAGDFDKDGDLDIVTANLQMYGGNPLAYFENVFVSPPYTENLSIDIGSDGDEEWAYPGEFSDSSVFSGADFVTELNSFLPACTCPECVVNGKNCTIALGASSDAIGVLGLSNLRIEYAKPATDSLPALILETYPANNSYVPVVTLINISVLTNEDAHCRYSNSSGTPYENMTDFDVTGVTTHYILNVDLQYGENYIYHYRCNDTEGNVHASDLILNFTSDACKGVALTLLMETLEDELMDMDGEKIIAWEDRGNNWYTPENLSEKSSFDAELTDFDDSCRLMGHWMNLNEDFTTNFQVSYFANGTWSEAVNISERFMFGYSSNFGGSPGAYVEAADLDLSQDGSVAIAVWANMPEIFAREWDGNDWETEVNISKNDSYLDIIPAIAIAPDNSKALAVWVREGTGAMSAVWDSSTGWGTPALAEPGNISYVDVVFDGDRAIAVFEENGSALNSQVIAAKEWTESGGWDDGSRTVIHSNTTGDISLYTPMVGIDNNGKPMVVWREVSTIMDIPVITVSYSYEQSEGYWTPPQNISQRLAGDLPGSIISLYVDWIFPQSQLIHTGLGDLMFVWYDMDLMFTGSSEDADVYEVRWNGTNWTALQQITALPQGESCPYVYSFDGNEYHYEHESYPYAVLKSWEYETYETLEHLKLVDGQYLLQLREELPETSYTNNIGLTVVEHSPEVEVYPDIHGRLHTIREKIKPIACSDHWNGDCLQTVSEPDSNATLTDLHGVPLGDYSELRDFIEVEFPKPEGKVEPKLMVRMMKTEFMTRLWLDQLEQFGRNNIELTYYFLNEDPIFSNLMKSARDRGVLSVDVWDGEEWIHADGLGAGLKDWNDLFLQLGEVDTETLKIRFESVVGTYTIDSLYVDYSEDEAVERREAALEIALTKEGENVREALLSDDDLYITQKQGDIVQLVFTQVPEDPSKTYSYIVNVKGYYLIDPPPVDVDLDPERLLEIAYMWAIPGEITRQSMIKYLDLPEDDSPERFAQAAILAFETVSVLFLFAVFVMALMVLEQNRKKKGKIKKKKTKKKRAKKKAVRKRKATKKRVRAKKTRR